MMFNRKQERQQPVTDARKAPPKLPSAPQVRPLEFLAYALPRASQDANSRRDSGDGFYVHDEPLGLNVSFLDYDGVIMFAGAFERPESSPIGSVANCLNYADLDRREREFFSAFEKGIPIIFLLPAINSRPYYQAGPITDLFRRITQTLGIGHSPLPQPHPGLASEAPEFREYIQRHGVGYAVLSVAEATPYEPTPICREGEYLFGLSLADKLFILPCTEPANEAQVGGMVRDAVAAVIAYRKRVSRELPAWVAEFAFNQEAKLITEAEGHRKQFESLNTKILVYQDFKAALCLQSDPLVEAVVEIFNHFFGLDLVGEDQKIEDKFLLGTDGNVLAIIEVKGINSNFDRKLVNQLDDHRERRELPPTIPGIAIVNTFRSAGSLDEKDQPPNSEIIEKAVHDNVLLIRTLDLLRFADLVERGIKTKEEFKNILLGESGWLKVEGDNATVVKL
ncbi:MAG: hypothetical protein ACYCUV_06035 [Phycisphaerae bacterium]